MLKILIADSNISFAREIKYYLNSRYDIQIVTNNVDLHQSLFNTPDCIIANYEICFYSNIFLTDNLASISPLNNTVTYILAGMNLKAACNILCDYNIDHFSLLPINPEKVSLYTDYLINQRFRQIDSYETIRRNQIEHILICMGVYPNKLSSRQLGEAIFMCVKDHSYLESITKRLYPELAITFLTTPTAVEKNLRSAIQLAINNGSNVVNSLFPNTTRIKNHEFLFILSRHIRNIDHQPILMY